MKRPIKINLETPKADIKTIVVYEKATEKKLITGDDAPTIQYIDDTYFLKTDSTDAEKARRDGCKLHNRCKEHHYSSIHFKSELQTTILLAVIEGFVLAAYQFNKYKSQPKEYLPQLSVNGVSASEVSALEQRLEANYIARDLVNEPQNTLTATQLSKEIETLSKESGFALTVLDKKAIEKEKMGGLLEVNKGSVEPPTFNIMDWNPEGATKTLILVGKGVVYDTGGLSLKSTPNGMDFMKSDMAGSAAVIGAMQGIAKAALPIRVIGLVAATDNRPSGNAYAPGDVITMYSGKTVEVLNTDAEGRLTLADALHYAKQYNPNLVIDIATLTGAAARSLGPEAMAMMGTASKEDKAKLMAVGQDIRERLVEFPLWDDYGTYLKSSIADITNLGGGFAGAITAGKFLEHFIDYPWIHLDIAGSAFTKQAKHYGGPGATGVGARLLLEFARTWSNG